jgi:chitinase
MIRLKGGIGYSQKYNPWTWLTSQKSAEAMAVEVAKWPSLYGCDGIDLDIENGAGEQQAAGPNMMFFIKKLRQLVPKIIISQPTYGFPQVHRDLLYKSHFYLKFDFCKLDDNY